ncbi:Clp protease N-terminal domain-containing protein [Streptantibioticus ferralitis]|uniref:Clp protease N-terminal domain-containing protein n=1 Tax=Streptantibioticus ferralitis TaxID=236510 RepID=A0ABT5YZ99_9ACTN|nr:Clp protease N-terminal domain-containing protein [Streptantibioticus ferralitis]MDF2256818.1 Clp protease N-terminal domain-containing protein [Streptantibioticus ferralitis]
MFERFSKSARDVVEGAVGHAERVVSETVAEEHLLLSLLEREGTKAAFVLNALGVTERRELLERALGEARRRGGISRVDAEALAGLGIDVTEIVARVEDAHGRGALATGRRPRHWWSAGHRPFTREAKAVLERSLRAALARGDRHIGDEHILLALAAGPGVVADVLAEYGASQAEVERVLGGDGKAQPLAG